VSSVTRQQATTPLLSNSILGGILRLIPDLFIYLFDLYMVLIRFLFLSELVSDLPTTP